MKLSYTPTLVYSVLGLLVLALAGMAFDERPVVVSALVAIFCVFVAEVQADRTNAYNDTPAQARTSSVSAHRELQSISHASSRPRRFCMW